MIFSDKDGNESKDLRFASKIDCLLAVESFRQAGILTEQQMIETQGEERRKIATQLLRW